MLARPPRSSASVRLAATAVLAGASLLAACSGGGGGDGLLPPPPPPPPPPGSPTFATAASLSVAENVTGVLATIEATDSADAVSFSITGGADAALFALTGGEQVGTTTTYRAELSLAGGGALDFDRPNDADANRIYEITVRISDGTNTADRTFQLEVTDVAATGFAVRRVGSGFTQPLFVTDARDGTGRVFVVEKGGRIWLLDPATGLRQSTAFLEIATSISTDSERGLLGMALAPDYESSGVFYVAVTNLAGDTEVRRFTALADRSRADTASEDVILRVDQPAANHNGGWMDFGPSDGHLYIAIGDGGGGGDPFNQGQDTSTLLGAIVRIDPSSDAFPADDARDYAIPASNPFADGTGGAPELVHWGLRNPFRASFNANPGAGELIIGDVGQDAFEEISVAPDGVVGRNFGWPRFEASADFRTEVPAPGAVGPEVEYAHTAGIGRSITGGYVYAGEAVDPLSGLYIFGDFITGRVFSVNAADLTSGPAAPITASGITDQTSAFAPDVGALNNLVSFGEGPFNDLYLVDFDGDIFRVEEVE